MDDMTVALIIFVFTTIGAEIEIFFVFRHIIKKLQNTKLLVASQFVERSVGKSVERINFSEIKSLKIVENPTENLVMTTISSQKTTMELFGLDDMESLLDKIENSIVDKSIISRKLSRFISNKLAYQFIGMAVGAGIVLLMFYLGRTVYINFVLLLSLFSGLFFMVYRPLTRFLGSSFRVFEIVAGFSLVLFSFGLIYLIYIR
jgi:hypothetical protein